MSLLNPVIVAPKVTPLVGLVQHRHHQYYEWTVDESRIANDPLAMVGDTFSQCFAQLLERFPSPPGTCRVFPISYGEPHYILREHSELREFWDEFYNQYPRLSCFSSSIAPYGATIVTYGTPIITTSDPHRIVELLSQYGTMPHALGHKPPVLDDPLCRFAPAKSTFAPGALPQFIPDPDGRIAARRARNKLIKKSDKFPLNMLCGDEAAVVERLYQEQAALLKARLSKRSLLPRSPLRDTDIRKLTYDIPTWSSYSSSYNPFHAFIQMSAIEVTEIPTLLKPITEFLDDHHFLINLLCKQEPTLRTAFLDFLLTFTNHSSTLCYLICEAYLEHDESHYDRARQLTLNACFAVARVIRNLKPTPLEIRNVRDQHQPFDPDPYLAALRKRRK